MDLQTELFYLRESVYGDSADFVFVDSTTWPYKGLFSHKFVTDPLWNPHFDLDQALEMYSRLSEFTDHKKDWQSVVSTNTFTQLTKLWEIRGDLKIYDSEQGQDPIYHFSSVGFGEKPKDTLANLYTKITIIYLDIISAQVEDQCTIQLS